MAEQYITTMGPASEVLGLGAFTAQSTDTSEAQPEEQPVATDTQQTIVDPSLVEQAAEAVGDVDLNALEQQLNQLANPNQTTDTASPVEETVNIEENLGFEDLNKQFKQHIGVDLKTAVDNYASLVKVSQDLTARMREMERQTYLREQHVELQSTWMNDPEFQQGLQQGKSLQQMTQERINYLTRVYNALPKESKQKVDSAGVRGVTALWNTSKARTVVQQMPGNTAASPTATGGKQYKWSEIVAMDEKTYISTGIPLLDSGNYIDDRTNNSGNNNGSLQRTFH